MPGGIQVFARALGMTTKELLKASEEGKLLASEVLPLVAIELSKTARNNDALSKSLKTSRSQWTMTASQFKLIFDGFGSKRLDRGVASFIESLKSLLVIIKPAAQVIFWMLGAVIDLAGIVGKALTSAFKGFTSTLKMLTPVLKVVGDWLDKADNTTASWLQKVANMGIYFVPIIGQLAMLMDGLEEFVNIFTGDVDGLIAGKGDTVKERLSNGIIAQELAPASAALSGPAPLLPNVDLTKIFSQLVKGKPMISSSTPQQTGVIQINMDGVTKFEEVFDLKQQQQFEGSY